MLWVREIAVNSQSWQCRRSDMRGVCEWIQVVYYVISTIWERHMHRYSCSIGCCATIPAPETLSEPTDGPSLVVSMLQEVTSFPGTLVALRVIHRSWMGLWWKHQLPDRFVQFATAIKKTWSCWWRSHRDIRWLENANFFIWNSDFFIEMKPGSWSSESVAWEDAQEVWCRQWKTYALICQGLDLLYLGFWLRAIIKSSAQPDQVQQLQTPKGNKSEKEDATFKLLRFLTLGVFGLWFAS